MGHQDDSESDMHMAIPGEIQSMSKRASGRFHTGMTHQIAVTMSTAHVAENLCLTDAEETVQCQGLTGGWADYPSPFTGGNKAVIPLERPSTCPRGKGTPSEVPLPDTSISILEVLGILVKRHSTPTLHHMKVNFGIGSSCY